MTQAKGTSFTISLSSTSSNPLRNQTKRRGKRLGSRGHNSQARTTAQNESCFAGVKVMSKARERWIFVRDGKLILYSENADFHFLKHGLEERERKVTRDEVA